MSQLLSQIAKKQVISEVVNATAPFTCSPPPSPRFPYKLPFEQNRSCTFQGLGQERKKKLFKDCLSASKLHSFDFANLNLLYYQDYQSFDLQSLRLVEIKIKEATRKICNDENRRALQVVSSCHPGWEKMETMENTENMEKMENIDQTT